MRLPEFSTLVERRSRHVDAMIDDVLVWRHFLVQVTGHELDRHWCNMAWPASVKTTAVPDQRCATHHRQTLRPHEGIGPVGVGDLGGIHSKRLHLKARRQGSKRTTPA